MLSQLTIPKQTEQTALNREQLYALGLKHIQRLSSEIWTDYNLHDPGITTLELLCYALTDLSYRASFPIADLLATKTDNAEEMKQQFFTARQILPSRPLTLLDYRKLLLDIDGVKNAWLQPFLVSYYADIITPDKAENIFALPRIGCATLFLDDIINLSSLANKLKQPSDADKLSQYLSEKLSAKTKIELSNYNGTSENQLLTALLVQDLNKIIQGTIVQNKVTHSVLLYGERRFVNVTLSNESRSLLDTGLEEDIERLNRMLLEDAYEEIAKNQWLRDKSHLRVLKKLNLSGLYEVKIEYGDQITTATLKQNVRYEVQKKLQENRNLCEDFVKFNEVEIQPFQLCAELELTPDADTAKVNAAILSQVQEYLSPSVRFYTLSEMLARMKSAGVVTAIKVTSGGTGYTSIPTISLIGGGGTGATATATITNGIVTNIKITSGGTGYTSVPTISFTGGGGTGATATATISGIYYTVDEIFDGPALESGFIDDEELGKADLRGEIRLSDIISIIMDIPGVQAVRDIVINPEGSKIPLTNKWVIPVAAGKQAKLNPKVSRLVFYKRNMPVVPGKIDNIASTVQTVTEINDLEIPLGKYRDLANYYSVQNHFPAIYGLSEIGLSSTANEKRKALAYQLKAYLLFFDQIMANYLAQLSHIKELFSLNPVLKQTYFYQVVNSFNDYQKIYATENVIDSLESQNNQREESIKFERRNRFLDHLIARFAEQFHDFANIMYSVFAEKPENIINYKCEFLKNYPTISSDRALAYNYSLTASDQLWNTDNVSGLEKRLAKLLGISNYQRRNLGDITYDIYAEVDENPTDEFRFRIRKRDTLEMILSSRTKYTTPELARTAMEQAIHFALIPSMYQRKVASNGKHYFNIINDAGQVMARRIEYFNTEAEMNQAIDELREYLTINYSDEGMYVIENILLRPDQNTDPFLPICPAPNCTDCAETDPYSYRLTIILPAYSSRFRNMNFRRFTEEVIRQEIPAHILPKICWIDKNDMAELEKLYRDWIYLKAGVEKANRTEKLKNFIEALFTVKNVYSPQKLSECSSSEDQPKFILGRTIIGSEP